MTSIERIETVPLRVPLEHLYRGSYYQMRNRCTIMTTVRTSGGMAGRAYNADTDEEQAAVLSIIENEIAPLLAGMDVLAPERCWEAMLPVTFDQLRDRRLAMQAIACVDTAIWDAVGKAAGMPLWRLWGGYRSELPVIGIGGYYGTSEADIEQDMEFFAKRHGMVGMKFKIGGRPPEVDADRLRFARSLVDDDFLFIVDANQGYTVTEALEFLRLIRDDVPLRWFEEPTRWHSDLRGLRDVRLKGDVRVAAGQSEISRVGMRELIVNSAIDVCNFDASWGGGPSEWRRVAAMAAAFDVELGHHEESQVSAHLLTSVPNGTFMEVFSPTRDPIFWNLLANRAPLQNGRLPLPQEPGLGWTYDEDFIARYRVTA
ncbi:MAG TPA: mandelate racemase/muconate lactonizing enzyme family protein [Mycobacteriales bacterium]|nr:mandelate racemase/muconate lactonizing enzyme family protein [Mycobacteriales bacterium]